ncbi:hypothetical protein ACHQM5_011067 [Ranunculus cassubicifolius]
MSTTTATMLYYYSDSLLSLSAWPASYVSVLWIITILAIAALLVIAVRATVVTWITVLVLLAFAGKRRKVLVRQGSNITADVTMYAMKNLFKERTLLTLVFVVLSCLTHIQLKGTQSSPYKSQN